jgi:hypothetical protein
VDAILFALPDDNGAITFLSQSSDGARVTSPIVPKLGSPEFCIRFGYGRPAATGVVVPEAAIDENGPAV